MTKSVGQAAAATLYLLTSDLEPGEQIEFRDRSGVHMTLYVERFDDGSSGSLFTVAHRHHGREPVPDPAVVLLLTADGCWMPLSIALPLSRLATADTDGVVIAARRSEHRRLVKLVEVWMRDVHANLLRMDRPENQEIAAPLAYAAG